MHNDYTVRKLPNKDIWRVKNDKGETVGHITESSDGKYIYKSENRGLDRGTMHMIH